MWTNDVRQRIEAAPEDVFAVWTDLARRPEWDDHDEWVKVDGPIAVGGSFRLKTRGAPAATLRIIELVPGRRFATEGSVPLGKLRFIFEVRPAGGGSEAVYRQEMHGPASGLMGRLFGPGIVRDAPVTMERLAARIQELRG